MGQFEDAMVVCGMEDAEDEQSAYATIQREINRGNWSMEGSYGRTMMRAIEDGYCMLGKVRATDAYGSRIPSCDDVQEGTKGSYQFVADAMGDDWAAEMKGQPWNIQAPDNRGFSLSETFDNIKKLL